jgi:hypothetical protein
MRAETRPVTEAPGTAPTEPGVAGSGATKPASGRKTAAPPGAKLVARRIVWSFQRIEESVIGSEQFWSRGLAAKPHWCYSNPWDVLLARQPPLLKQSPPGSLSSVG